jgi:hypothetical protein
MSFRAQFGHKGRPEAGLFDRLQGVRYLAPSVEISHDVDACGVWCPDCETDALDAVFGYDMRAELFVCAIIRPLMEQVDVVWREPR